MWFTKGKDKAPIIWTLNSLSEKIMANVPPSDQDPQGPDALDEETYNEVALRDLRGDPEINRIILNVQAQSRLFSNQSSAVSEDAKVYESQVPADVLFDVQADLETLDDDGAGGIDLHKGIGVDDDSESEDDAAQKMPHVGSRSSLKDAQAQILEGMKKRRAETYGGADDEATPMGIPAEIAQRCYPHQRHHYGVPEAILVRLPLGRSGPGAGASLPRRSAGQEPGAHPGTRAGGRGYQAVGHGGG